MHSAIAHHDHYASFGQPLSDALFAAAALIRTDRVLDVGCGTGDTTLQAAACVPDGFAHGVDHDAEVIGHARVLAAASRRDNVSFAVADAAACVLDDGGFDRLISRNGTLHFAHPEAAYANLRRACRPGGRLTFTALRGPEHNPWFLVMQRALGTVVPLPEARGPFVLADPDRVRSIVTGGGWTDVHLDPVDTEVPVGKDVDDTLAFFAATDGAPLKAAVPAETWSRILDALATAVTPYASPRGVWLGASTWVVSARA